MSDVKWVAKNSDVPNNQKSVLVTYGDENALHRHSGGLTYTVNRNLDRNLLEAHLQTVISEAQSLADFERIDTVYVTIPKRMAG
jgi:hypothetical protein